MEMLLYVIKQVQYLKKKILFDCVQSKQMLCNVLVSFRNVAMVTLLTWAIRFPMLQVCMAS